MSDTRFIPIEVANLHEEDKYGVVYIPVESIMHFHETKAGRVRLRVIGRSAYFDLNETLEHFLYRLRFLAHVQDEDKIRHEGN